MEPSASSFSARVALLALCLLFLTCPGRSATRASQFRRKLPPNAKVLQVSRTLLEQQKADEALKKMETPLSKLEDPRLLWLQARALTQKKDLRGARKLFLRIAKLQAPLSSWARLRAGELAVEDGDSRALEIVEPLSSKKWAAADSVDVVYAQALALSGKSDEAVAALRQLASAGPKATKLSVIEALAQALAERTESEQREAIELCQWIEARSPFSRASRQAESLRIKLLKTLSPEQASTLYGLTDEQARVRADALLRAHRYHEAEQAYAGLADRAKEEQARCELQLEQGRAILRQRKRPEGAQHMIEVAKQCKDKDVQAWAHFHAGRALGAIGKNKEALAQYAQIVKVDRNHRLADDAVYRSALLYGDLNEPQKKRQFLDRVIREFPQGDMVPEARFVHAWEARQAGRLTKALSLWSAADGGGDGDEARVSQSTYWAARTAEDLGRTQQASALYSEAAQAWPLSFYAQLALARLAKIDQKQADALRSGWRSAGSARLPEEWLQLWESEPYQAADDLLQVGEKSYALKELAFHGLLSEDPWPTVALLAHRDYSAVACQQTRRRWLEFRAQPPRKAMRLRWSLAYPEAYKPLIEQTAAKEDVPAAFVRAVAREESSFDPHAVSPALAYGLIQLIQPTAKRYGSELGLPYDRAALHTPRINLRIGSHFIRALMREYDGRVALVPAAYNAGPNAVNRWLQERGDKPLDEWIETIPYKETRRYTRRVLQTYGIYSWMTQGKLPALHPELAASASPSDEKGAVPDKE